MIRLMDNFLSNQTAAIRRVCNRCVTHKSPKMIFETLQYIDNIERNVSGGGT